MRMLLAFAPFILFAIVERFLGPAIGLVAAAAVAVALLVRDWMSRKTPKVLEAGTAALFGGWTVYALWTEAKWSVAGVRLRVDAVFCWWCWRPSRSAGRLHSNTHAKSRCPKCGATRHSFV